MTQAWPPSATSSRTSSPTRRSTGNQLAVFTDARGLDDATMQALALEIGFSETVFVLPAEQGGHGADPDLHPARTRCRSPGHPTLGTAFVLGGAAAARRDRARDGRGNRARRPRARRVGPDRLRADGAAGAARASRRVDAEAVLAALGVGRSLLPVELYDNGARHIVVTLERGRARARSGPTARRSRAFGVTGVNCVARDRARGAAGCSGSTARIPRRARRPARSPATSPATAWSPGARRSSSRRAWRSGRPSALHARAEGGDGLIDAVEVGGSAVVVARGEFRL